MTTTLPYEFVLELSPQLLMSAPRIAVLGAAGTGKTSAIKTLIRHCNANSYSRETYVHTSTTGISAINAGGTTINSLLHYYRRDQLQEQAASGELDARLVRLKRRGCCGIVIDEISMMDGRTLDLITFACDAARMPLVIVGDPGQLQPVGDGPEDKVQHFFQAETWPEFKVLVPTKVHRQQDGGFVQALNQVRVGHTRLAVDYLLKHCTISPRIIQPYDGLTLVTKNQTVDRLNEMAITKLQGPWFTCHTKRSGTPRGEWRLIPNELKLCPGMHVMVLANLTDHYANGDLGTVEDQAEDGVGVLVRLRRNGCVVKVMPVTREVEFADQRETGRITYMPLRAAYAATFHKSQSLTLPHVQVSLRTPAGAKDGYARRLSGGLYTAFSRVTSPQGLTIIGDRWDLIRATHVDPVVHKLVVDTSPVVY